VGPDLERLGDRQLEPARFGESARVDQVETVGLDDAFEHAERRGGEQCATAADDGRAAAQCEAAHGTHPAVGEDRARDRGRAPRDEHRRLELTPLAGADGGNVDRPRDVTAEKCVTDGDARVNGDVTLRLGGRCANVRREDDVRRAAERVISRQRLGGEHVEDRAPDVP
jgi:hypothetical protein